MVALRRSQFQLMVIAANVDAFKGGLIVPSRSHHALAALSVLSLLIFGCTSAAPQPTATRLAPSPSPAGQPQEATPTPTASPATAPTAGAASPAITAGPGLGFEIPSNPALFGTGLVPEGWQIVEDATGACRIAVPPDWTTDIAPGTASSSALSEGLAGVSAATGDWEAFKDTIDQFYLTGHVVVIDTADVFLIANPIGPDFDLSYVLALRFDDVNCQLLTTVQRNWITQYGASALLIAETLDHTD